MVGDIQGDLAPGALTDDARPQLLGKTEPGSLIRIFDTDGLMDTIRADKSGNWQYAPDTLSEGRHVLTVQSVNAQGNTSPLSAAFPFQVDTLAPAVPVLTGVTDDAGKRVGNVRSGGKTDHATLTLSGTAEAGSMITVKDNGTVIGTTPVSDSGDWRFNSPALANGRHDFRLTASDATGNTSTSTSSYPITLTDNTPPPVPVLQAVYAHTLTESMRIGGGGGQARVDTLRVQGSAEAYSRIEVYDGTARIGGTLTNTVGQWIYTAENLADGIHRFRAIAYDAGENASKASSDYTVSVDTVAPGLTLGSDKTSLKAGETAVVTFKFSEAPAGFDGKDISRSGGTLGELKAGTDGKTYTALFTPTDKTNSLTASVSVAAGSYTDAAGNAGGAGSAVSLKGDTLAPTLSLSSDKANLKAGETAVVTFKFSEAPTGFDGKDITLSGGALGELKAGADGKTYTALFTPTDKTNSLTASVSVAAGSYTDAAGNAGGAGSAVSLKGDTLAPTLSLSSDKANLKAGDTATITFSFSEDPGSTFAWNGSPGDVTVSGGTLSALSGTGFTRTATFTPTANTNSLTASIRVAAGTYTDAAGNAGIASNTLSLTGDTLAPTVAGMAVDRPNQTITLTFDSDLKADSTPANSQFVVNTVIGGVLQANSVSSVTLAGRTAVVTLGTAFEAGQVTVDYTDAAAKLTDLPGNPVISFSSGKLADGYMRGASLYVLQSNGQEYDTQVTTNENGDFFLPASTPAGALIARGGINIDTGIPNAVELRGSSGSRVINPLTTLVQSILQGNPGKTAADVSESVSTALGLPAGTDLTRYNPLAVLEESNTTDTPAQQAALAAQKAAAQVVALTSLASSGASNAAATQSAVMSNLANQLAAAAEQGGQVDLGDSSVIGNALSGADGTTDAAQQANIADALATIRNASNLGNITAAQTQFLDTIAPNAPSLPTSQITNDTTPVIRVSLDVSDLTGKAVVAGDTVAVLENGVQIASVTTTASDVTAGYVDVAPERVLSEGLHTLKARVIDKAGNASVDSASTNGTGNVTIDTQAPQAPAFNAVATDDVINLAERTAAVAISGTAEAGATVSLQIAGQTKTVTNNPGNWSYTLTPDDYTALGEGNADLTAWVTDAAGNRSDNTGHSISLDTVAPGVTATIGSVIDNVGNTNGGTEIIASGNGTNDNTPQLTGTLTRALLSGENLAIYDTGSLLGVATVAGSIWTFNTPGLANATHSFTAKVLDLAGNAGSVSSPYTVTVAAEQVTTTSSITTTATTTNDQTPLLTGMITGGYAGNKVAIYDGKVRLGEVSLTSSSWSYTPGSNFSEGSHGLTAVVENAGGNQGTPSSPLNLTIDTTQPTLTISSNATGVIKSGQTVTYRFDFSESVSDFALEDVTVTGGSKGTTLSGTGKNYTLAVTPATNSTANLSVGVVNTAVHDAAGNSLANAVTSTSSVDTLAPTGTSITDIATDNAINAAEKAAGVVVSGAAEAGSQVTLQFSKTVSSQSTTRSTTLIADSGTWNYPLTAADYKFLDQGSATLSVTATDAAGNVSTAVTKTISVDTLAPLLTPLSLQNAVSSGATVLVNTPKPTLQFTAESGTNNLAIDWNGDGIYEDTTASGTGSSQTLTAPTSLGEADRTLRVKASDAAGNSTERALSFELDATAPTVAGISANSNGSQLTLVFSEPVSSSLSLTDITVSNSHTLGTGASLAAVDAKAGRASTFTITAGNDKSIQTADTLAIDKTRLTDLAGNTPAANLVFTVPAVDTIAPTVTISTSSATLKQGDVATLSFAFSEPVTGFTKGDIGLSDTTAGVLGNLIKVDNQTYTISFQPKNAVSTTITVNLAAGSYTDLVGNNGGAGSLTNGLAIDTQPPSLTITSNQSTLKAGATATVSLTFSEAKSGGWNPLPSGNSGLVVSTTAGTLSNWTGSGQNYTATLTPTAATASGTINFTVSNFQDTAGNVGLVTAPAPIRFDTLQPTVTSVTHNAPATINAATASVVFNYRFSEAVTGLTASSFTPTNGTVSNVTGSGDHWTVTLTPAANTSGTLNLTLNAGGVTDSPGNGNAAVSLTAPLPIDTAPPTAVASFSNAAATSGTNVISLSGSLTSALGAGEQLRLYDGTTRIDTFPASGTNWSYTTPALSNASHSFTLRAVDAAGNPGPASSAYTVTVNATVPTATVTLATDIRLTKDNTPTLSGTVSGTFTSGTDTVAIYDGATQLGQITLSAANWSYTIPDAKALSDGSHSLTARVVNSGDNQGAASNPYNLTVDTTAPSLSISKDTTGTTARPVTYTFTFSEPVTGFEASDITVSGGTKSVLSADSATVYRMVLTPAANSTTPITVSVPASAVTDRAGNASALTTATDQTVDTTIPSVTLAKLTSTFQGFKVTTGAAVSIVLDGTTLTATTRPNWFTKVTSGSFDEYRARDGVFTGTEKMNLSAQMTNQYGTQSAVSRLFIEGIDTQAPAVPVIQGLKVVSGNIDATVQAESGSQVKLYKWVDAGTTPDGVVQAGELTALGAPTASNGLVSFTGLTGLSDDNKLVATASDNANNTSGYSAVATVDKTPPSAPTAITLSPQGGNVVANTINSTNLSLVLTATITAGQATGGKAEFYLGSSLIGTDDVILATDTSVRYTTSDGTPTNTELQAAIVSGGVVKAKLYDAAGNSIESTANPSLSRGMDTPAAPSGLALATADDTGQSNSDGISKQTTGLTFSGAAASGRSVQLYTWNDSNANGIVNDGETTAQGSAVTASGSNTFSTDLALAQGTYTLIARITDQHGNLSLPSNALNLKIDTTAPSLTSARVSDASLLLTYSEPLASGVPAATAYTVKVNGSTVSLAASNPVVVDNTSKVMC